MNQRIHDGGLAFPSAPGSMRHQDGGVTWSGHPGMTLRDYFMAHAPAEPQPWFDPVMPPKPTIPKSRDIEDERTRQDVMYAENNGTDADTPGGAAFFEMVRLACEELAKWEAERKKQRYIQWPAAWADAMLAQRGVA